MIVADTNLIANLILKQDQTETAQEVQAAPDLTLSMQGFLEQAQSGNT